MNGLKMKPSDTLTIEQLRQIGRDIHKIGDGQYEWPLLEAEKIGDLTIVRLVQETAKPAKKAG